MRPCAAILLKPGIAGPGIAEEDELFHCNPRREHNIA
jgi:hypothetical protein